VCIVRLRNARVPDKSRSGIAFDRRMEHLHLLKPCAVYGLVLKTAKIHGCVLDFLNFLAAVLEERCSFTGKIKDAYLSGVVAEFLEKVA